VPHARPDPADVARYTAEGWWGQETVGDIVRRLARERPDATAFVDEHGDRLSGRDYDLVADRIAAALLATDAEPGDRVAVIMPDGGLVHAAFVGAERAGLVVVGIGHRAGEAEIDHLVGTCDARIIITAPEHRSEPAGPLVDRLREGHPSLSHHVVITPPSAQPTIEVTPPTHAPIDADELAVAIADRRLGPNDLYLLNSTSGTTGLPKCVMHTQNRWFYFHRKAQELGDLGDSDVFLSALPAPFGFGQWTSHFSPTLLGVPCVVMERFSAEGMLELMERERVTVLCCVSTQFIMALNSPDLDKRDLGSLRVMFTGGEAIPYHRAQEFEQRTGAVVLNFYGSNETGALSGTSLRDDQHHRLTTGGRAIPEMHVRLYDPDDTRTRIPGDRGRGIPACRGPANALGYLDERGNEELFTEDGWMLMGDLAEIDVDGWLRVVGRTSDFVIRGGKNISASAVENEVGAHPAVRLAAAVPTPDEVFGERVAVFAELHEGHRLTLEALRDFLVARGVTMESIPEYLFVVDALPRASGGKVAKGDLRRDAARRVTGAAS
jgi:acyl-CoA synthetase